MTIRKSLYYSLIILFTFSCMNDDKIIESNELTYKPSKGVFIINEGNFQYGNASLSYYDIVNKKTYNDVFYNTNGLPLGDVAQSMKINDSLGFVVINNSGKVYVININNFKYVGKITGLTSPRYIHFINENKAYITDLYAKSIVIINPKTFEIIGSINTNNHTSNFYQHPTEQMVQHGKYIFTNCWSYDNKVLVIDSDIDKIIDSIEVLTQPNSIVIDKYNKLWVLCDGGFEGNLFGYEKPGLVRIDTKTHLIEKIFRFNIEDSPSELAINKFGDTIYFLNKHVYQHSVKSSSEPKIFFQSNYTNNYGGFYGLAVDPYTSEVYVADAIDFVQRGIVYRITPNATVIDTFKVGIIPGAFCFNPL